MNTTYNSIWNESVGAYVAAVGSVSRAARRALRSPLRSPSVPMALEQRIMFDGALLATAVEVQIDAINEGAEMGHLEEPYAVSETKASASKGFRAQLNAYGLARRGPASIEVRR